MKPNQQIQAIKPSATMAITAKAKQLQSEGVDVVGFGAGEPDFDTPAHIKQAAIDAIQKGVTKYTAGNGTPQLRKAVAERFRADYGLNYTADQIIVSNGAKQSLYNLLRTVIEPGDEVLVIGPYWVSYPDMIQLSGGKAVIVATSYDNGFRPTRAAIEAALTNRTRGVIINSPSNPTGAGYDRATLQMLADIVLSRNLWAISDEIYDKLVYDGFKHIPFVSLDERLYACTATVNGLSKAYAMTGWRIGYAAGPEAWIKACAKLQDQSTSNASSISQAAAVAALTGDQSVVESMRRAFEARRTLIVQLLNAIEGVECPVPQGAFYAFPRISKVLGPYADDGAWAADLLEKEKVALVPGGPFGAPGHVRLSYATSEAEIRRGVERIAQFVTKYCR